MSQIVSNNVPHTKLDPLSPLNHQVMKDVFVGKEFFIFGIFFVMYISKKFFVLFSIDFSPITL